MHIHSQSLSRSGHTRQLTMEDHTNPTLLRESHKMKNDLVNVSDLPNQSLTA